MLIYSCRAERRPPRGLQICHNTQKHNQSNPPPLQRAFNYGWSRPTGTPRPSDTCGENQSQPRTPAGAAPAPGRNIWGEKSPKYVLNQAAVGRWDQSLTGFCLQFSDRKKIYQRFVSPGLKTALRDALEASYNTEIQWKSLFLRWREYIANEGLKG